MNIAKRRKSIFLASLLFALSSCGEISPKAQGESIVYGQASMLEQIKHYSANGINLTLDEAKIEFGSKGEGDAYVYDNYIDLSGASLSLKVDSWTFGGLSLDLDVPLAYVHVGDSNDVLRRKVGVRLVGETLYIAVSSLDEGVDYDVRYKVGLTPYSTIVDGQKIDVETGGEYRYSYGDLDFVLDSVFGAIGGLGESFVLPTIEDGNLDLSAIENSLDNLVKTGASYYRLNLDLEDMETSIGFQGDSKGDLARIDFPAKGEGYYSFSNMRLAISALVTSDEYLPFMAPLDAESYLDLVDSIDLFANIASYVKGMKFGIITDEEGILVTNIREQEAATATSFGHAGVNESARLLLSSAIDFSGGSLQSMYLHGIARNGSSQKSIEMELDGESLENGNRAYIGINDKVKVETSLTTLSSLLGDAASLFTAADIQNEAIQSLIKGGTDLLGKIADVIDSPAINGISNNNYVPVVSSIVELVAEDNHIHASLDCASLGLGGTIDVDIDGTTLGGRLATVSFNDVALDTISVNGNLHLTGLPSKTAIEDKADYVTLTHLPNLGEQIAKFTSTKRLKASLEGYILTEGTTSVVVDNVYHSSLQGFTFSGNMAFDLHEKKGAGSATFVDRKERYVNDHNVSVDITGPVEEGDENRSVDEVNCMLVKYDSKNASGYKESSSYRSEPTNGNGLYGKFSIYSLNDILKTLATFLHSDDPRFERILNKFKSLATNSMLSDLTSGQYLNLIKRGLLDSIEGLGSESLHLVINKDVLGIGEAVDLRLGFDSIGISAIEVRMKMAGEEKTSDIYIKIGFDHSEVSDDDLTTGLSSLNRSTFDDFSSISTLLRYLYDTASMGITASNKVTTFHIGGTISVAFDGDGLLSKIANLIAKGLTVGVQGFVRLIGAEIEAVIHLDISTIEPINGEGSRYVTIFYHNDGSMDNGGDIWIRTLVVEEGGSLSNGNGHVYGTRTTGKLFMGDFVNFLLYKIIGVDEASGLLSYIIKEALESALSKTDNDSSDEEAIHGEDLLTKAENSNSILDFNHSLTAPQWRIGLNIEAATHTSGVIDPFTVTINGKNIAGKNYLTGLSTKISLLDELMTARADLTLDNIYETANANKGIVAGYNPCWENSKYTFTYYNSFTTKKGGVFNGFTHYYLSSVNATPKYAYDNDFYTSSFYGASLTSDGSSTAKRVTVK